jgi:excisionase family DNA binding protein
MIFGAPDVCGHLAVALHVHQRWLRSAGFAVPSELLELERACVLGATEGQAGTSLEDLWRLRDADPVTRQLLPYADAAIVLGCSVRHVKRLVADGALPVVRLGSASVVRVRAADLAAFIEQLRPVNGRDAAV